MHHSVSHLVSLARESLMSITQWQLSVSVGAGGHNHRYA